MSPPFRPSLVEQQFSAALDRLDDKHESADYWVAFSGGLDSTVLLHLLLNRRPAWLQGTIRAIHVDHSIHPESVHWAAHCGEVAAGYGVPLVTRKVVPGVLRRANLEASARRERYRLIAEEMAPDDLLVTAHHLNDQSETLLLQLFRGGGIRGGSGPAAPTHPEVRWLQPAIYLPVPELDQAHAIGDVAAVTVDCAGNSDPARKARYWDLRSS